MKSALVLSLAILAPLAASQSIADRVNALEGCQKECLMNSLKEAGCGETDLECGCSGGSFAKLGLDMANCALPETLGGQGCTDIDEAVGLGTSVCGGDLADTITSKAGEVGSAITSGASAVYSHAAETLADFVAPTATPGASTEGTDTTGTGDDVEGAAPQITGAVWIGVGVMAMMAF